MLDDSKSMVPRLELVNVTAPVFRARAGVVCSSFFPNDVERALDGGNLEEHRPEGDPTDVSVSRCKS